MPMRARLGAGGDLARDTNDGSHGHIHEGDGLQNRQRQGAANMVVPEASSSAS